jgi:hypothetical protein
LHEDEKERLRELYREWHEKKENIHRVFANTQVSPLLPNIYEPIVSKSAWCVSEIITPTPSCMALTSNNSLAFSCL